MKDHEGFTLIELMIVIAIIGILAAIAIPNFVKYRDRSIICEGMYLFDEAKKNIAEFYEHTGVFPADNTEAGLPAPENMKGKYVESITVEDGAVNVKFYDDSRVADSFNGTTMTFRPAVLDENPTGTVIWIQGGSFDSYKPPSEYKVFGEDITDMNF